MKKLIFGTLISAMFICCAIGQNNLTYEMYCNSKFSYCLNYPTTLLPQGESDYADGQSFRSADNEIVLLAWGGYVLNTIQEEMTLSMEDKTVTYKVLKPDYFVISGYTKENKIFYQKTIIATIDDFGQKVKVYKSFQLIYPKNKKAIYNKVCGDIAKSLK